MDALTNDDLLHAETLTEKAYRALEEEIPRMRHLIGRTLPKPG